MVILVTQGLELVTQGLELEKNMTMSLPSHRPFQTGAGCNLFSGDS
jgi:hypothetical protein